MVSVHLQEIPIFQIEIHGDKANPNADKPKMALLACWALAYMSITFCMLVKARSLEVYKFKKDRSNEHLVVRC